MSDFQLDMPLHIPEEVGSFPPGTDNSTTDIWASTPPLHKYSDSTKKRQAPPAQSYQFFHCNFSGVISSVNHRRFKRNQHIGGDLENIQ